MSSVSPRKDSRCWTIFLSRLLLSEESLRALRALSLYSFGNLTLKTCVIVPEPPREPPDHRIDNCSELMRQLPWRAVLWVGMYGWREASRFPLSGWNSYSCLNKERETYSSTYIASTNFVRFGYWFMRFDGLTDKGTLDIIDVMIVLCRIHTLHDNELNLPINDHWDPNMLTVFSKTEAAQVGEIPEKVGRCDYYIVNRSSLQNL
jgi:hypothetical protein